MARFIERLEKVPTFRKHLACQELIDTKISWQIYLFPHITAIYLHSEREFYSLPALQGEMLLKLHHNTERKNVIFKLMKL